LNVFTVVASLSFQVLWATGRILQEFQRVLWNLGRRVLLLTVLSPNQMIRLPLGVLWDCISYALGGNGDSELASWVLFCAPVSSRISVNHLDCESSVGLWAEVRMALSDYSSNRVFWHNSWWVHPIGSGNFL
jgi:hypothetical protein